MLRSKKQNAHDKAQDTLLTLYEYLLRMENIIQRHMMNNDNDAAIKSIDKAIAHYDTTLHQINAAQLNADNLKQISSSIHRIVQKFYDDRNKMKPDQGAEDDITWALAAIEQQKQQLSDELEREEQRQRAAKRFVTTDRLFSSFLKHNSASATTSSDHQQKSQYK